MALFFTFLMFLFLPFIFLLGFSVYRFHFLPPKNRAVAHKDENIYVTWNPKSVYLELRISYPKGPKREKTVYMAWRHNYWVESSYKLKLSLAPSSEFAWFSPNIFIFGDFGRASQFRLEDVAEMNSWLLLKVYLLIT